MLNKIILFVFSIGLIVGYTEAQDIVTYAREYRADGRNSQEQETERLKVILSQTCEVLPHYEVNDGLQNTVHEFVLDSIGDLSSINVIDTRTTEFFGKSQDIAFLIKSEEGALRYVVKAFQNPCELSGRFLPEISAMDLIRELNLPGISPIHPNYYAIVKD
jgi:hypothetical protein